MKIFIKMMFNLNIINQENPNLKNKTRSVISETSRSLVFKGYVEKALSSLEEGLTTLTSFYLHVLPSAILFPVGYPEERVPHVLQGVETRLVQDIINLRKLQICLSACK